MTPLQLHIVSVHIPVVGTLFACLFLAAGLRASWRGAFHAGLALVLLSAGFGLVAYVSGPPTLEAVRGLEGGKLDAVSDALAESHAAVARGAYMGLVVAAALAIASLVREAQGESTPLGLRLAILGVMLACAYGMAWAAHLGGQVRHVEARDPPLFAFPRMGAE